MKFEPTWKEDLFFILMGLPSGICIGIWLCGLYGCGAIDTARFVTMQDVKPLHIITDSDSGVLYNAKHSLNNTSTTSKDSVLVTVSSYINDKSIYTDTPTPACPWCGYKEFTKYYSRNTVANKIVPHLIYPDGDRSKPNRGYFPGANVDNVVPDFNRCNECGKDFTVDKHKLTRIKNGVLFTSDKWFYTTMIHRHE